MHKLTLTATPTGRFKFVGRVPVALVADDPEVLATLQHCGEGFARKCAKRKGARFTTSWPSEGEALDALAKFEKATGEKFEIFIHI